MNQTLYIQQDLVGHLGDAIASSLIDRVSFTFDHRPRRVVLLPAFQ